MPAVRTVLWIGRGERFAGQLAADAPLLDIVWEPDATRAAELPRAGFDAVVLDAASPDEAHAALRELRRGGRRLPPLLVRLDAAAGARAIPALRDAGADDVLLRDADDGGASDGAILRRLRGLAAKAAPRPRPPAPRPGAAPPAPDVVGRSRAMREVFALVACAARAQATVLLTGETGTGKEVLARAIHRGSPRRGRPFVAVNCAAFPDTLLESELFGHVRGSFTGADRDKKGLFEAADGGTLFLDEVGETSGPFQAKLLRALQEREVRPVGGARARRVDVRVVAATNRELSSAGAGAAFREDLYYRLAVFPIHVPPLRERPEDVLPLAAHFLALHARRDGQPPRRLASEAAHLLQAYPWPGNVRELDNEIQRALAVAEPGQALAPEHFSERLFGIVEPAEANLQPGESLRTTMGRIEAWLIRRALDAHGGRRAETARRLQITREGLYKKMKRHSIE